jgi:hypothetical protein
MIDSVGINVYTKTTSTGGPTIVSGTADILPDYQDSYIPLPVLPTSVDSIMVTYNNEISSYLTNTDFTSNLQFTIDWANSQLIIPPQAYPGKAAYSIVGVGGGAPNGYGTVDKVVLNFNVTSDTTSTVQLVSLGTTSTNTQNNINSAGALVTVNGGFISQGYSANKTYFLLTYANENNHRAAVDVYNLPLGENTVQAWFLRDSVGYFNEIKEQVFTVGATRQDSFQLTNMSTATIQPLSGQAIVEITDTLVTPHRTVRLLPPDTRYYTVTAQTVANPVFPVNITSFYNSLTGELVDYRQYLKVNVYRNGKALRTSNYSVTSPNNITIVTILIPLSVGDAIAVETMMPGIVGPDSDGVSQPLDQQNIYNYNYRIAVSTVTNVATLYITPGVQAPSGTLTDAERNRLSNSAIGNTFAHGLPGIVSATIRVITYSDSDSLKMETQRFVGNPNRTFKMDRPILDSNYVWVSIDNAEKTTQLTANVDFEVMDDRVTILISDRFSCTTKDNIVITSFSSGPLASTTLGYRIFNDILGNTQFNRLSKNNTTYLIEPLSFTDTSFRVADASVLSQPQPAENIPGVVIIAGERIEFFQIDYTTNRVSQLRRATLGTGPCYYLEQGSKVIDQGYNQQIPFRETTLIQNTFTNTLTNTYVISKSSLARTYPNTSTIVECDGITLSTVTDAIHQISLYYGGRQLNKSGVYYDETTATYDGISLDAISSLTFATVTDLPTPATVGRAYRVLDTNKVWVYTGYGFENSSVPGYRYSGIRYRPADFNVNTQTQTLILNTSTVTLMDGVRLSIVKRQFSVADSWNTLVSTTQTLSILDSDTVVAKFLQAEPAELPDSYYYGGDRDLTDASGDALTTGTTYVLQGY